MDELPSLSVEIKWFFSAFAAWKVDRQVGQRGKSGNRTWGNRLLCCLHNRYVIFVSFKFWDWVKWTEGLSFTVKFSISDLCEFVSHSSFVFSVNQQEHKERIQEGVPRLLSLPMLKASNILLRANMSPTMISRRYVYP